jgi:hypothetical protein
MPISVVSMVLDDKASFNPEPTAKASSWFREMQNAKPRMQTAKRKFSILHPRFCILHSPSPLNFPNLN